MIVLDNSIFILATCMRKFIRMKDFCYYDSFRQSHIYSSNMHEKIHLNEKHCDDSYRQPYIHSNDMHEKIYQNEKFLFL